MLAVSLLIQRFGPENPQKGGTSPVTHGQVISGYPHIADGDTLSFAGERIRLFGVDAPEKAQMCTRQGKGYPCGENAKRYLAAMIGEAPVSCDPQYRDKYDRAVAICSVGGKDIGREMVAAGWAVAYRRYSTQYVDAENGARGARAGIWQGSFEQPEQWRIEHPR